MPAGDRDVVGKARVGPATDISTGQSTGWSVGQAVADHVDGEQVEADHQGDGDRDG
jgi:hypothetical protein